MKELEFIEIIKSILSKNSHIGDDCAYLKDLNIVITQDSLVEGIHFSLKTSTPYSLGYKSIIVNISDILASGAKPEYITVSLSLPKNITNDFVKEFYKACNDLSKKFDFEIIGGDITGADKIFISVCAIGKANNRQISSRKNAKIGDYIVTTGVHGSSAAGLWLLQNNIEEYYDIKKVHLMPSVNERFSNEISQKTAREYAMMDTSDGLADALFKIAQASNALLTVDFEKIPFDRNIKKVAELSKTSYKDWVLYGGEDYQLVACVDKATLNKINADYTIIGEVKQMSNSHFVEVKFDNETLKIVDLEQTFNHFK